MKILKPATSFASALLKKQHTLGCAAVRFARYVRVVECNAAAVLFNLLTKELVFLDEDEWRALVPLRNQARQGCDAVRIFLYEHWFLVDEAHDDSALITSFENLVCKMQTARPQGLRSVTILPTTDCNARCYYCYELGCEKQPMSERVAIDIGNYLLRHKAEEGKLKLRWFGGEPLLNSGAISAICNILNEGSAPFTSMLVSNGLCFSEGLIQEAVDRWHLNEVQITLDGTRDVYNRTKAYESSPENAFETVLNNVEALLEHNISVRVRLNMSGNNFDDLCSLCNGLAYRFGAYKNFSVYSHILFQYIAHNGRYSVEQQQKVFEQHAKLVQLQCQLSLRKPAALSFKHQQNYCMADDDASVVIMPDGRLYKCDNYTRCNAVGSIYSEEQDKAEIEAWKQRASDTSLCADCALRPACIRLEKCPDGGAVCNTFIKAERLYLLDHSIRETSETLICNSLASGEPSAQSAGTKECGQKQLLLRLAGQTIAVTAQYPRYFERFAGEFVYSWIDYLNDVETGTRTQSDLVFIRVSQADIDYEKERATEEIRQPDAYFETLAVYRKIAEALVERNVLLVHGSALCYEGKAYLFIAPSGTGKSTHARLWRKAFGEKVTMINDDKPLLRFADDGIYVCGTPWSGKHHLSTNTSAPLAGICVLEQAQSNAIERLDVQAAFSALYKQTYKSVAPRNTAKTLQLLNAAAKDIAVFRLSCLPNEEAARLAHNALRGHTAD